MPIRIIYLSTKIIEIPDMKYSVYSFENKTVCTPSSDYYSRGNDWATSEVEVLSHWNDFDTEEEAIKYIEKIISKGYPRFTILKTISF